MKLLLTSVFGPFGVDDEFGRKENIMELFHNQVTKEQGVFSLRMNHESMGLHLMAENINVPTVVLDFPSKDKFIKELKKGYDYIGITFIVPNFLKTKHMAELIRKHSPGTKIILGGHGTSIENIKELIGCDHVCKGDGVSYMRKLFNNDVTAPINHPLRFSSFGKHVMGASNNLDAGVILTGVGCPNSCRFCCTTHYFNKTYTPFYTTGKEIFDICVKMEKKLGVSEFFVMDENFLKQTDRAKELVTEMEKHGKNYAFNIFSSAEAVTAAGLEFIQKLGVNFLWMGAESKKEIFEKNENVDFQKLVKDLKDQGVSVLASGIVFLEHHTKETIHEDIDFMTDLNADFVQFMQLGPLPGTKLYEDYDKAGKLRKDIPYEEWHGQHKIWFKHPEFTPDESELYLKMAFLKDLEKNGPSILRISDTAIRGVLATKDYKTPFMKKRHERRIIRAQEVYPLLDSIVTHAPNNYSRDLAKDLIKKYDAFFGPKPFVLKAKSLAVQGLMIKEKFRSAIIPNNMRQPKTYQTSYRMMFDKLKEASFYGKKIGSLEPNILKIRTAFNQLAPQLKLSGILDTKNIRTMQTSVVNYLKKEKGALVINLTNLQQIEKGALRDFFKKIEGHKHRLQLVYSENVESTKVEIEKLMNEFSKFSFTAV